MIKILFIIISIVSIGIGIIIAVIFFKIIERRNVQQYKSNCTTYKAVLNLITQDLLNETSLRNHLEKKIQYESQITYELHGKLSVAEERLKLLDYYNQKCEKIKTELNNQLNLNHSYELKLKELNIRFEEYKISSKEKEKSFINNEHRLIMQFENLSNRIFDQTRNKINEQNRIALDKILDPFREQLDGFKSQIQDSFCKEERIRRDLTYEIHNLHKLNSKITQETINLTQALKGKNKTQGNWGEVILIRALEAVGMREGHEFHCQTNIKQIDGRKLQPDIIVHLPNGKDIIIDSKLSLVAYERYFNSENERDKHSAITEHIHSIRMHIKLLSKKDYQKLPGLNTLDYVLMFIPIESAFAIAIEKESSLLTDAINYNIMLVSPTTLFVALRTINNLWSYERQNCYAKKIAEKASRLYDKLRLFMDDLHKIGQCLHKAEIIYSAAKNKFSEGKGNIINQVEGFRDLGVQIKQPIAPNISISTRKELVIDNRDNKNLSDC